MTESERRQILDQIARSIHAGNDPETYQASVDQLVDDGMSLEIIDAEVNDRIARIQTDEDVDNLRQSVKKRGLLIGCLTAAGLLLLSVAASVALISYVLPALEQTPAPDPQPAAVPTYAPGHWLIFVDDPQEIQPGDGGDSQSIVTVRIVDKEGAPPPDGLEAQLNVDHGTITPMTAAIHNGVLSALFTPPSGSQDAALTVRFMNDQITRDLLLPTTVVQVAVTPPTVTPTPTESPTPTPKPPPPTPTPTIEIAMGWNPKWSDDTIYVGVGEPIDIMINVTREGRSLEDAKVSLVVNPELATLDPIDAAIGMPVNGGAQITLTASNGLGSGTIRAIANTHTQNAEMEVKLSILQIAEVNGTYYLRDIPSTSDSTSKTMGTVKAGEKLIVEGKHSGWLLVRVSDGRKLWIAEESSTLKPQDGNTPNVGEDAAVLTLLLQPTGNETIVPIFSNPSGDPPPILAELPAGVEVKVLNDGGETDLVPVEIILWVPEDHINGQGAGRTLSNSTGDLDVCEYQTGIAPIAAPDMYCGTLKETPSVIKVNRDLVGAEEDDEATLGEDRFKLVVVKGWVKGENLEPS